MRDKPNAPGREVRPWSERWAGMTAIIGYAPGAYDLFHVGHLNILRHARQRCDFLVAGVVSDEMCLAAKGRLPFVPVAERWPSFRAIVFVDDVHEETTPDKLDAWRGGPLPSHLQGRRLAWDAEGRQARERLRS